MPDYAGASIEWTGGTITLLELTKQLLGIADTSQDAELSMYLDMAGQACETYCDNKLVSQDVTEQYANSQYPLALRYWITGDISAVTVDGVDQTAEWKTYKTDGVTWASPSTSACNKTDYFNQLDITYAAGYDPLPSDLGYAIATVAIGYEQAGGTSVGSVKKEVINGVGSVEYVTGTDVDGNIGLLSPTTIGVLDRYRRFHV